jgi:hypothetical protein
MGLIFRTSSIANPGVSSQVKNAALTYAEGDGNFAWLSNNLSGSIVTISGSTNVSGTLTVKNTVTLGSNPLIPLIIAPSNTDYLYIGTAAIKSPTEAGLYNNNSDQMIAVADIDNENYYYSNGNYKFNDAVNRHELTGSVRVTGSLSVNVTSPSYTTDLNGTFRSVGTAVIDGYTSIRDVLNLEAQNPLPTGALGDLATSGSALWFYDGGSWREVNLL